MIPRIGQEVRLSAKLLEWARSKKQDALVKLENRWGKIFSVDSNERAAVAVVDMGTLTVRFVLDTNGRCQPSPDWSYIPPFVYRDGGDPCPKCGNPGVRVPMACVCRNPECGHGVIWGI